MCAAAPRKMPALRKGVLVLRMKTHEVRTLFRNAMLQTVYGLSRPGIMFVRACLLNASLTKGTHFVRFCAKASVLAGGLAVGGVAFCFAGNAEGLLRPPRVNGEVDLRTLSRPRAGPPTFAKTLARPRGAFCRPHRSSHYGNVCKNAVPDFRGSHGAESYSGHSFFPIARFHGRFR